MLRMLAVLALATLLCGCVTVKVGDHQPSLDTVSGLRDSGIAPLNVADFKLAPGVKAEVDRGVSARGTPINPPQGQTFSGYLRNSLVADLKAAGKYDAQAPLSVQAELTANELHAAGFSTASAVLAARFRVMRGDQSLYDKVLRQEESWPSSFAGAIAIPDAINHYTAQYPALLARLYADSDFRQACAPPAQ
ncbi:MAG TPA: hypothetical protein VLX90_15115 [Steroidobacteraceae bacterium]|nr:hypothetical protein [Steroidobacteraceae bacterium]